MWGWYDYDDAINDNDDDEDDRTLNTHKHSLIYITLFHTQYSTYTTTCMPKHVQYLPMSPSPASSASSPFISTTVTWRRDRSKRRNCWSFVTMGKTKRSLNRGSLLFGTGFVNLSGCPEIDMWMNEWMNE